MKNRIEQTVYTTLLCIVALFSISESVNARDLPVDETVKIKSYHSFANKIAEPVKYHWHIVDDTAETYITPDSLLVIVPQSFMAIYRDDTLIGTYDEAQAKIDGSWCPHFFITTKDSNGVTLQILQDEHFFTIFIPYTFSNISISSMLNDSLLVYCSNSETEYE